ncbi:UspA domain protein [Dehalogenimonas lykanthroporepellens BL-DC-9]|jgi:nucleotide-binding universal stress UspA family protein|nr:UspA domain protein [Dehalogenimonas lykanthroporepellens BL-DC-9]
MAYRKILVPLDGSESAEQALPFVRQVAGSDTELVLFSVCPEDEQRLCRLNQVYLEVQSKALEADGFKTSIRTEPGELAERIKRFVARQKVDLIVACRQPHTDLNREDKMLQNLVSKQCSLLLIKPGTVNRPIKRILLPLDGSVLSEEVVPYVLELAGNTGAEVVLLSVNAFPEIHSDRPPSARPSWEEYALILMKETREQAGDYLERVSDEFSAADVPARTLVLFGGVAESILKASEDEKADLIAMSTHARSGIDRWVFGSVTATVSATSRLPLLLVKGS